MTLQTGYRVHEWGATPRLEEFDRPEPGPGEVLVEVEACGVGLTVLNCINGDLSSDPGLLPRVPGHEFVGRVIQLGAGADPDLEGRRVTAYFYLSCGTCITCSAGLQARCERLAGWVGVHRDGGYAPYAVLPELNAVLVPDDLDPVAATVAPDAVATPLHVSRRADIGPGDRVAVIGAGGGVGVHMIQVAALFGATVAGLEVEPEKLAAIDELGIRAVDSSDLDTLDSGTLWTQGAPTVVIDLVGTPATLRWSASALGTGGRMVVLTTFRDRELALDPRELVFREAAVLGSRYATRAEVSEAAQLLAEERIQPIIGKRTDLAGVLDLHHDLQTGQLLGRGALDWTEGSNR